MNCLASKKKKPLLVLPALNVSSVYNGSFLCMGWYGIILNYIVYIFFITVTIGLISKKSPYYVCLLTSVNLITIFNLFDNMFVFMGLIPVPFLWLLLDKFKNYTFKKI